MENGGAPFGEDSRYETTSRAAIDVGRLINGRSARDERKLASRETEPVVMRSRARNGVSLRETCR